MKKSTKQGKKKSPETKSDPSEVQHLDESLTRVATKARERAQRYWKAIVGVCIVLVAVVVTIQVTRALAEAERTELSRRLWELTHPPSPGEEVRADPEALRELVEDARGSEAELPIVRLTVDFLLSRAEAIRRDATTPGMTGESSGLTEDDRERREELFAAADEILSGVAERFAENRDVVRWSRDARGRLEAERDTDWLPPAREYRPRPPRAEPADPDSAEGGSEEDGDAPSAGGAAEAAGDAGSTGEDATPSGPASAEGAGPSETDPAPESGSGEEAAGPPGAGGEDDGAPASGDAGGSAPTSSGDDGEPTPDGEPSGERAVGETPTP